MQFMILDFIKDMFWFCQSSSYIDLRSKVIVTCSIFLNNFVSSCIGLTSYTSVFAGTQIVQDIFPILQVL